MGLCMGIPAMECASRELGVDCAGHANVSCSDSGQRLSNQGKDAEQLRLIGAFKRDGYRQPRLENLMKRVLMGILAAVGGIFLLLLVVGLLLDSAEPEDSVVVDELEILADGASKIYKLDPGSYKVEMTASNDGAQVRWVGASCGSSGQVTDLETACSLDKTGQLVVENPTEFGQGASTSVTIKVTKLGREL